MKIESFQKGMAVYKSLGGKNLDETTLDIWWSMLKGIQDKYWEPAVIALCRSEKSLATINFVAEIETIVKMLAAKDSTQYHVPQLLEELVPKEEVKAFVKQFTKDMNK